MPMSPTLRSSTSAQSSPSAARKGNTLQDNSTTNSATPSTTPRKAPQCSKCKRPKAGHPRSGCPWVDSPSKENGENQNALERHLSVALESMVITSPARALERDEDTKAFIRNRRRMSAQPAPLGPSESLLSLSTNSSEIVARLLQPGMFDDTDEEDNVEAGNVKASRIVRWQETIAATPAPNRAMKSKTPAQSPMPGTLIPPTPEGSFASSHDSATTEIIPEPVKSAPTELDKASTISFSVSTEPEQPWALTRSMSAIERDIFVSRLSDEACATIYIIPKVDVDDVVARAVYLKFFTHISMCDDEDDSQALVILGRDEQAVDALLRKVENENKKASFGNSKSPGKGHSTLKTAAGAAVVGAVTAWAGLAFS